MTQNYAFKTEEPHAKAFGSSLSISTKQSIEIANHIRGRKVERAKTILQKAMELAEPIPYKRFNGDVGHRRGNIMAGRYPVKACTEILKLIKSAEANAEAKGLATDALIIKHICAHKGPNVGRFGRHRGRRAKRTHIEIILTEKQKKEEKK